MNNTENNKLITEFMGYKPAQCNNGFAWDCGESKPNKDHLYPIQGRLITKDCNYLKFHSSWDWLIPVVNQIKNTGTQEYHLLDRIDEALTSVNKPLTYIAVVEFIKWYNEQKK